MTCGDTERTTSTPGWTFRRSNLVNGGVLRHPQVRSKRRIDQLILLD